MDMAARDMVVLGCEVLYVGGGSLGGDAVAGSFMGRRWQALACIFWGGFGVKLCSMEVMFEKKARVFI